MVSTREENSENYGNDGVLKDPLVANRNGRRKKKANARGSYSYLSAKEGPSKENSANGSKTKSSKLKACKAKYSKRNAA